MKPTYVGFFALNMIFIVKNKLMIVKEIVKNMINEELTKNEINQLITQRLNSQLESAEFMKKVKDIIPAVLEELFKVLWQKRSFWQSSIKR